MRKKAVIILFQAIYLTGYSENPRWKYADDKPIPACADLDVRWDVGSNVPTNKWPAKLWIYELTPRKLSPKIISNLMLMCSFTEKDNVQQDTNGVVFKSPDGERTLTVSFVSGSIRYHGPEPKYVLKPNFFEDVPRTEEMPKLTKYFLKNIGIKLSEIQKNTNGVPSFYFDDRGYEYLFGKVWTTNLWGRAVGFRRAVDGAEVIGDAGYCRLTFGEHGKISQIDFSWPDLKREKSAPTLKPQVITQLIRQGKAFQGATFDSVGDIDWLSVKSVTIKQAWPCYFAGDSNLFYPFLALWTTVDTGHGNIDVGIDCPIIDESKN
jgi:hypothetical protein